MKLSALAHVAQGAGALMKAGALGIRPDHNVRLLRDMYRLGPLTGSVRALNVRRPDAAGIIDERGPLSYRELEEQSNALARGWARRGISAGDVIAAFCRDHRGLLLTQLASSKLGARLLMLNTGFGPGQLADVIKREGAVAIVYDQEFSAVVDNVPAIFDHYLSWVDNPYASTASKVANLDEVIAGKEVTPIAQPTQAGTIVLLTSGTTGTPKGAQRDLPRTPLGVTPIMSRVGLRMDESVFIGSPLFHATGFLFGAMSLAMGSTVVVRRRFDPEATLKMLADNGCAAAILVPVMLQRILDLGPEIISRYTLPNLRVILCAGSAMPPALTNRALDTFGDVIYNLYGGTESAVATIATPKDLRAAPGTAGYPIFGTAVRLFGADDREITKPGTKGRIFVGSELKFAGYTDGTTKPMINELMSTGDVGHFDRAGRLFVDGRDDDMILSGAENVFPGEVEDLLITHDRILDVAVIGVPDEEFGQRLKAFVVPQHGAALEPAELTDFVKTNLARHKVPREYVFLTSLPRNATGKVVRRQLAEM